MNLTEEQELRPISMLQHEEHVRPSEYRIIYVNRDAVDYVAVEPLKFTTKVQGHLGGGPHTLQQEAPVKGTALYMHGTKVVVPYPIDLVLRRLRRGAALAEDAPPPIDPKLQNFDPWKDKIQ